MRFIANIQALRIGWVHRWSCALVKKGKLRARSLAANPRVQAQKRQEKQEIASWFQVWLETPDLFADWLALRKSSDEFLELFGIGSSDDDPPKYDAI